MEKEGRERRQSRQKWEDLEDLRKAWCSVRLEQRTREGRIPETGAGVVLGIVPEALGFILRSHTHTQSMAVNAHAHRGRAGDARQWGGPDGAPKTREHGLHPKAATECYRSRMQAQCLTFPLKKKKGYLYFYMNTPKF